MRASLPVLVCLFLTGCIASLLVTDNQTQTGGDICEYYGIAHTVQHHASLDLRENDVSDLETELRAPYYSLWYCYLTNAQGTRYPIHFPFYGLLLVPVKAVLELAGLPGLESIPLTNSFFLLAAFGWFILRSRTQRLSAISMMVSLVSPLIFFITWPGPDLWYASLLLIALTEFLRGSVGLTLILLAVASWHSQPLLVPFGLLAAYFVVRNILHIRPSATTIAIHFGKQEIRSMFILIFAGIIAVIPFVYNLWAFGVLSPWTILRDTWTQTYGFGIHNVSVKKLFEQFFDLNIGVFWYMPLTFILGVTGIIRSARRSLLWLSIGMVTVITAFMYQTNPAWHYGTSGYGPSRHALFAIPVLILAAADLLHERKGWVILTLMTIAIQIPVLSMNGLIRPDFTNALEHSPVARFVLDRWPSLYNPTPEIFVDRTNHTDAETLETAVYTSGGQCRKAYVAEGDTGVLLQKCGYIPDATLLDDIRRGRSIGKYVNYSMTIPNSKSNL